MMNGFFLLKHKSKIYSRFFENDYEYDVNHLTNFNFPNQ